jgi:hypothetical protein
VAPSKARAPKPVEEDPWQQGVCLQGPESSPAHLAPLVGVVAGAVAAREDVAKRAQPAVLRQRLHHQRLGGDLEGGDAGLGAGISQANARRPRSRFGPERARACCCIVAFHGARSAAARRSPPSQASPRPYPLVDVEDALAAAGDISGIQLQVLSRQVDLGEGQGGGIHVSDPPRFEGRLAGWWLPSALLGCRASRGGGCGACGVMPAVSSTLGWRPVSFPPHLAQKRAAAAEVLGGDEALVHGIRQLLAGLVVLGKGHQCGAVVAPAAGEGRSRAGD